MYELLNDFLQGLTVYLTHILNPSLMTASDWGITILIIIAIVPFIIGVWKWAGENNM